ncbi:TIGR03067 domain-containing protein [Gimesia chilikensis]|uniref:TIGR03067 domain-containing protein n=1 Tax=Gimesia chilikensis TaxID=2605989 RepID=UPI0011ECDDE4|nr:TIGR03067 domain-containing protein [Gimesia chilikensis]KAA0141578.1 TIGR03067 domain-containing protein [Gimesia chilikensis]
MQRSMLKLKILVTVATLTALTAVVSADEKQAAAIQKDRNLIAGTWQIEVLEINGNRSAGEDVKQLTVVNGADGTWSLRSDGNEVGRGTTSIDPSQSVKTIDIQPTSGQDQGKTYRGIYELGKTTRKLCFAPAGKDRPTDFSSNAENQHIFVKFKRVQATQEKEVP